MKTKYYPVIFFFFISCFSCYDGLNIKPSAELEGDYFSSEERIEAMAAACYAALSNIYTAQKYMGNIYPMIMLPGDDICPRDAGQKEMEAFSGLNPSNGNVSVMWSRLYQLIYRTNFVFDKMENPEVKEIVTTPGLYNAILGEAYFLRSWAYFKLWDYFRKAPLQNTRIVTITDAYLPPTEGFEMLDQAIEDLKNAAENLLPSYSYWNDRNTGRVFDESAWGLLVKCYVTRARYNTINPEEDYTKAIHAFEKIQSRQLVHFAENFDVYHENNMESLFEYQASNAPQGDNPWLDHDSFETIGQMGAFYHYFTTFWANDETGTLGPTQKLIDIFEEGDPRKLETMSDLGHCLFTGDSWPYFSGWQMKKYIDPERTYFEPQFQITSTNNYRLLRYADVKLLAAEAYLQTGNITKAVREVNDIRARARISTTDGSEATVPADITAAQLNMEFIMDERLRELAGEDGIRWMDLRGWHAAGYINLGNWTKDDFGYQFDAVNFEFKIPKHLLFPIPKQEMDSNPYLAASGNNPEYD